MKLFHEIYSAYYNAAAAILRASVKKTLTKEKLRNYIRMHAFGESMMVIPEGLPGEKWRLLHRDLSTSLQKEPTMPLSLLEKRWMKALMLDPRFQLFDPDMSGLEDIKPLYTPANFVYYDRYSTGDPYNDPDYIAHFRTIVQALRDEQNIFVSFLTRHGQSREMEVTPHFLEYSEKDDRFRLICSGPQLRHMVNLSRIVSCGPVADGDYYPYHSAEMASVTFELEDSRQAMERVLFHFSHLEKETKRLDETHYRVTLRYDKTDETEMVIRLLSFGPFVRVTEPRSFIDLLRERISKQQEFATFFPGTFSESGVRYTHRTENTAECETPAEREP